ncbi:MAG: TM1266 family iron-only hydrogenase system putative regulator [Peptococcaceae bacterium]
MEKRIGVVGIVVEDKEKVSRLNAILTEHSEIIIGRMGVPRRGSVNVIALIVEGSNEEVGALTGKLGSLQGIKVRSALTNHVITEG